MDNKEVLVKELKEDTNNTFTYIKENINSFKYYLSPLYAKRQIGKLRRKQQNTLKSPNKNIRKKIENFKREYQKSQKLNHTEQVSASLNEASSSINNFSVRQKLELIKKEYKQLKLRDLGYYVSPLYVKRKFGRIRRDHQTLGKISETIKDGALYTGSFVSTYVLLSLVLSSDISEVKKKELADLYNINKIKEELFEKRIDKRLKDNQKTAKKEKIEQYKSSYLQESRFSFLSDKDVCLPFDDMFAPYVYEEDINARVEKRLAQAKPYKNSETISLGDLLEKADVKAYEFQSAIDKDSLLLLSFQAGATNKALAKSADAVKAFRPQGRCLEGVQAIFSRAGYQYSNIISGGSPNWPEKLVGCSNNSACNAYVPLEKNGDFVIIKLENKAYKKPYSSKENEDMRSFVRQLSPGSIIITDNIIPDNQETRHYRKLVKEYGAGGKIHGHIAVMDNRKYFKSDGTEPKGPNFSRYGQIIRFPLPKDIEIPLDKAREIIAESERLKQEERVQLTENSNTLPYSLWLQYDRS